MDVIIVLVEGEVEELRSDGLEEGFEVGRREDVIGEFA